MKPNLLSPRGVVAALGRLTLLCQLLCFMVATSLFGPAALGQTIVLLDDSWPSGSRTNQNLPLASAWFCSRAYDLEAVTNSLNLYAEYRPTMALTYFTTNDASPVRLGLGDTLSASIRLFMFDFFRGCDPLHKPAWLRLGLFNFADSTLSPKRQSADGFSAASQGNGVQGYALLQDLWQFFTNSVPMDLRKRTTLADVSLLGTLGDWSSLGKGPGNLYAFPGFADDTPYTLNFSLRRTGLTSLSVSATWSNAVTGALLSTSVTDTTATNFTFDGLGFRLEGSSLYCAAYELSFNEVRITLTLGTPSILTPPQNQVVAAGRDTTFSVVAEGAEPLAYQWFFNTTTPLAGETNATLTLSNVQAADQGSYSVQVTNARGATNATATLTVNPSPPVIAAQPSDAGAAPGGEASFRVVARGSEPLAYQWQYNGTDLFGKTNSVLELAALQASNSGSYRAVVSNSFGVAQSAAAALLVSRVLPWGAYGPANTPPGLTDIVAVAAGYDHSLALGADGSVVTWGDSSAGQTNLPPGLSGVVAIACGGYHSLALKTNGTVVAWGANWYGQATVPPGLSNVVAIAGGGYHSLALKADGTAVAWGDDFYHQTDVPAWLTGVVAIAAGCDHSLALKADGSVVAWGDSRYQQTNLPTGLTNAMAIAGGGFHSVALTTGRAPVAWGASFDGQAEVPSGLANVVAIAAGGYHSLALKPDGTVVAWGDDFYGQTTLLSGLTNVIAIAGGGSASLALAGDAPPVLQVSLAQPSWDSTGFSLCLPTRSGRVYALEYKNSLVDGNWTALPLVAGTARLTRLTDPAPFRPQRFYRVREW